MSTEEMKQMVLRHFKTPRYIPEYLTLDEEKQLLSEFEKEKQWNTTLQRRTLHYGYEYIYTSKNKLVKAPPVPEWLEWLRKRVSATLGVDFDQILVNEYEPGQGISKHVDNKILFEEIVVSKSLYDGI